MSARSSSLSGAKILIAVAVHQFDLFGGFVVALRRPQNIGTQPIRRAAVDVGDHFQRQVVTGEIGQRARFEEEPLISQIVGQAAGAACAQSRQGAVGLAVHQINDGKPRRHLRARGAL